MRVAFAVALLVLPLAGCSLLAEPQVRELSGPTDGYTPTSMYLKLHLRRDDGTLALLGFDRRDWHTSEIARRVDDKELRFVTVQAMPREILSEYVVEALIAPEELDRLRYDAMGATPEQRAEMDAEYEALLARWLEKSPAAASPALPTAPSLPASLP